MKKLLFSSLLLIAHKSFSQTEKGTALVGGSIALQTTDNNSRFTLNPNVGLFVAGNFAVGGSLTVNFSKQGDVKTSELGIGPFVRYYIGKGNIKPFAVAEASYLTNTTTTGSTKVRSTGAGFLFGGGVAAFINQSVAVESIAGYNYSDFNGTSGSGGFTMRIGFQLYFNRHDLQGAINK